MSMQIGCSFAYLFEDVSIVDNTIRTSAKQQPLQHPVPALGYWKSASGCAADDVRSWQAPCNAGFCFVLFSGYPNVLASSTPSNLDLETRAF